jgi:hypothetical protein
VKIEAAKRGVTVSDVIRDALAEFVGVKPKRKPKGESWTNPRSETPRATP